MKDLTYSPKTSGPAYWRSLDELTETPEFRQWVEKEFPESTLEAPSGQSRRDFVKIMGASFLLGGVGLTGCRRPEETIVPFSKMPQNYVHGVPQYFATSMPTRDSAVPLLAKSNDGRPTKVEGNPDLSFGKGGTDAFAQASLLNLYDPDRSKKFLKVGNASTRSAALGGLKAISSKFQGNKGKGLHFLVQPTSSPSRNRLETMIREQLPEAKWHGHEPVDFRNASKASVKSFGKALRPMPHFDKAKVIFSLDNDFLGAEQESYSHIRGYADGRRLKETEDHHSTMNRLYAVESLMTLTGSNADHRLRVTSGQVFSVAAAMVEEIFNQIGNSDDDAGSPITALRSSLREKAKAVAVDPKWITESVKDLVAHQGECLVVAGYRQPESVHQLATALNVLLGNLGETVSYVSDNSISYDSFEALKGECDAGSVDTLVVLGGNPVYDAPADFDWKITQRKAKTVVRLGYYDDETSDGCDWHLPMAHYLESWGDARSGDGSYLPVQPLMAPLFDGLTELEVIARIAGNDEIKPYDIVRTTLKGVVGEAGFEGQWKQFLHDGYLESLKPEKVDMKADAFDWSAVTREVSQAITEADQSSSASKDSLEVVFHRDSSMDDGRFNNNGWMQEMPDPMTKITWDNVVLMSRRTAAELGGIKNKEMVEIVLDGRKVQGPVWIQPGFADFSLGLALGYGRTHSGRVGGIDSESVGFNAYAIRASKNSNFGTGAKLNRLNRIFDISCTQDHWSMEGRAIVREANLEQFEEKHDFAQNMDLEAHTSHIPHDDEGNPAEIYEHPYKARPSTSSDIHQWGMAIDLQTCVGCSSCVVACQSENNIPIVGKEQVANSREMHWMRIDRYYSGNPETRGKASNLIMDDQQPYQEWIDDPQVVNQPMICQHCESAPCESVCPVNATVHDHEGLNVMAYNRCVGTRYCSNNCAWKVRRFNYFDYNKRPIDQLYEGPLASRPEEDIDLIEMAKNPDVTVRMRGVMEKCTFCTQRIEQAKIAKKVAARDSGDIEVADGTIKTACQQACPADAIAFGNLLDPESKVSKLKKSPRNYAVLGFLDTRPRTTYLAKIRNPNKNMPDYHTMPLSTLEYTENMGSPFEEHGSAHGGEAHESGHAVETHSEGGQH
ncbi:MAG: TAT-variant-translocated molybdopterin oxidoreductase [Verrucomicrobia bacterium]|nr:TAT-variant-translocated molybdopterin oxidoreductase [Verrucomicrobiota bacterium]MBT6237131.1 TAT-variant-translocated molybdopterin oxidoreductase [Verrucomicrobiota bacterium]MBT6804106.1 TAT-variant-translocated molybdopterin oxidoreductase [Verrucomicrobiota bacterium]MBT7872855.1 TAT-variant-translocated molybdopterin oxidoreductase [Verrucomicrobiota bacterium]